MSKVLFLVNHDIVIYNFRLELVEKLLSNEYQVCISSPYGERINDLINLGCKYYDISIARHGMNIIKEIVLIKKYKSLLDEVRPSIVLSYTIKPNIYGAIACMSSKIPCVANITGLGMAVENKGIKQLISILLYRFSFRRVQRVFFQNTDNMQFFIDHRIAIGKHALLPGSGVNLERFSLLPYPIERNTEFAFVSRIMKEKGIDQYLEAAAWIRAKHPMTVFHVCGFCEDSYEELLLDMNEKGIIKYHGMIRDVKSFLEGIHCIIHPTYYPEGISNVLLEACACGRPIITTNRSGCREIIEDGVNGYVVRSKNGNDLIEKIEQFLALPYDQKLKMGLNGRAKVERGFDRNIVVNAYLDEIKKAVG